MMPGPKPPKITLTEAEKEGLEKLVSRRTAEPQKVLRGRIVLLAATGKNTPEIAKALGVSLDMTRLWRRRWLDLQPIGLDELSIEERLEDLPRPGAPAQITAD
jgi:transposase